MTKKLTSIALAFALVMSPYLYPLSTSAQFITPSGSGSSLNYFAQPLIPTGPSAGPSGFADTGRSNFCVDEGFGLLCLIQEVALVYGLTASVGNAIVPQGASLVKVKAWGAAGGSVGSATTGGQGALVRASFSVTPGSSVSAVVGGGGYGGGQTRFSEPAAGGGGFTRVSISGGGTVWAGGGGGEGVDAQEDSPYGGNSGGDGGTPNGGSGGGSGGGAGGADTFALTGCGNSFGSIGSSCTATQSGVFEQGGYGTGDTNGSLTPSYSTGSGGFNGGGGGGGSTPSSGRKGGGGGGGGGHKGGSGGSVVTGDTRGNGGGGGSSSVDGSLSSIPFDVAYLSRASDSDYTSSLNINGTWTTLEAQGVAKPFKAPTRIGGPGAALIQFWGPATCSNGASDYPTCTENLPTEGPTLTLTASPQNVYLGSPTTLTWTTTGSGVSCIAFPPSAGSGSWAGTKLANGSQVVTPTTAGVKTYEMECSNSIDWVRASVNVGVNQCGNGALNFPTCASVPSVSFSASPTTITLGNSSTLTWTTSDPGATCYASTASTGAGVWSGSSTGSGSRSVTPTTIGTKTYTVSCANLAGATDRSATVTVTDAAVPPEGTCPPSCPNPDGFTLGADRDVSVTAFSRGSAVSEQINIPINRTGSFAGPVTLSVQSIAPVLPTSTVMTFSLGGGSFSAAPSVSVTGSAVSFALSISEQIQGACGTGSCQNYYITLRGTDPSGVLPSDTLVLRVNQRGVTPVYIEQ